MAGALFNSLLDGELHGITVWAAPIMLGVVTLAHAVGGMILMVGFDAGPGANRPGVPQVRSRRPRTRRR